MFNMDDFDGIQKPSDQIDPPTRIEDNTAFVNNLMTVTRLIKETDFTSHSSKTSFVMHMINMSNVDVKDENAVDVITSLCTHLCVLFENFDQIKEQYMDGFDEQIMIPMIQKGNQLKIWDEYE